MLPKATRIVNFPSDPRFKARHRRQNFTVLLLFGKPRPGNGGGPHSPTLDGDGATDLHFKEQLTT